MSEKIVLIGGGEHARVLIDMLRTQNEPCELVGYTALAANLKTEQMGAPWLGNDSAIDHNTLRSHKFVLGIGGLQDPFTLRQRVARHYVERGASFVCLIHPSAVVSRHATLGDGTVVLAGAIVQPFVSTGTHVVINSGAVVEHDVQVGDFVQVGPQSAIGGGAQIGRHSLVGLGATVRDHITLGERVRVAMGAVVINSLLDDEQVYGIPAKPRSIDND